MICTARLLGERSCLIAVPAPRFLSAPSATNQASRQQGSMIRITPTSAPAWPDEDLLRRYQYAYDLAGNQLSESVALEGGTPTITSYTYNAANQISNQGFTYDANGNLTSDGVNSYAWDRANRLLSMGDVAYAYDGLSRTARDVCKSPESNVQ